MTSKYKKPDPRKKLSNLREALKWVKDAQKRVHDGCRMRKIDLVDLSDSLVLARRYIDLAIKGGKSGGH